VREYGRRPGDTGGATYGTPWGRATTNGKSVVGVSLGQRLNDIAIANVVWCMAYTTGFGLGVVYRPIDVQ